MQNFAIDLNDQPGAESWPIVSATFVLLPTDPKDPKQSAAVKKFFDWGFTHGDDIAEDAALHSAAGQRAGRDPRGLGRQVPGHRCKRATSADRGGPGAASVRAAVSR